MSPPGDGSDDDSDRAAIVARRQRFIAIALSSIATAACAGPQPCLNIAAEPQPQPGDPPADSAGQTTAPPEACLKVAKPEPCLEVAPPEPCLKVAKPEPCLEVAPPPDEAAPRPCLDVAPPPADAKPRPCLNVAPRDPVEPTPPQPCLKVAKPR